MGLIRTDVIDWQDDLPLVQEQAAGMRGDLQTESAGTRWTFATACLLASAVLICSAPSSSAQTGDATGTPRNTIVPKAAVPSKGAVALPQREVPPLIGKTCDQARQILGQAGLNLDRCERGNVTRKVPVGFINEQHPPAGTRYPRQAPPVVDARVEPPGDDVGPSLQGTVPLLFKKTCDEASGILANANLKLRQCERGKVTGKVPVGRINEQTPAAGTSYRRNAPPVVNAWWEPGDDVDPPPPKVRVPDVVNRWATDAEQLVRGKGLRARPSTTPVRPWHWVVQQEPQPNASVNPGSDVRLTLVARYTVPELTGRFCDDAARELVRSAGLSGLDCRTETVAGARPPGRIHRQLPLPRTEASQPITVVAWTPIQRVTVPQLKGLEESAADLALVKVKLGGSKSGPPAKLGRVVIDQSPNAGAEATPGDVVKVTLALRVPQMGGRSCSDAGQLAAQYGFTTLDCRLRITTPDRPLRRIFEQSPLGGITLAVPQTLHAVAAQGIEVPKLVDLELPLALQRLQVLGLRGSPDSTDGERRVVRQAPLPGVEVEPGRAVGLGTVRIADVPNVVSMTLEDGRQALGQKGFESRSNAEDRPAMRRIVSQNPLPNARVQIGFVVALTTVLEVIVPDTHGKPVDEARAAIESADLIIGNVLETPRAGPKFVKEQRPSAATRVTARSAVDLTLVALVAVPSVLEQTCDEATMTVENAGLGVSACRVDTWLPFIVGTPRVKTQSVTATSPVEEGTMLSLTAKPPMAVTLTVLFSPLAAAAAAAFIARPKPFKLNIRLRIVADPTPRVTIEQALDHNTGDAAIAWRVEPAPIEAVISCGWIDLNEEHDSGRRLPLEGRRP